MPDTKKLQNRIDELEKINQRLSKNIKKLVDVGSSLSQEKNINHLLEIILVDAKEFTNADAGTLYLMSDDEKFIHFTVVQTDSLGIKMGGKNDPITWPPLALYNEENKPNIKMVAVMCALSGEIINIPNVYDEEGFNFEGTKKFDASTGYHSKSMLVIPLRNHEDEIIGVLQLLNKKDESGEFIEFTPEDEYLSISFASQAAIAITNTTLVQGLENLLQSFIMSIAAAIDAKSPYTAGHIRRMAELTMRMVDKINEQGFEYNGQKIYFDEDHKKQIRIAAWMHDVGKIATPEYVVDKATKLETIYDRIHVIETRMEILKRDTKIAYLEKVQNCSDEEKEKLALEYEQQITQFNEDIAFLKEANIGGEFMSDDKIERIEQIASYKVSIGDKDHFLLDNDETLNLSIRRGTLNDWERDKINEHAQISYEMLKALPFPKKLKDVPMIASGHHEKLDGTGYPRGLKEDDPEFTLEGKLLAITDVFEALTASDRPYKEAKKLSDSMRIIGFMVKDKHLDPKLTRFLYDSGVYLEYAKEYLDPKLIDKVRPNF